MDYTEAKLETIKGGELLQHANEEINRVLKNIIDEGTEATRKRAINIKISFIPNDDRDRVIIDYEIAAKTAPRGFGIAEISVNSRGEGFVSEEDQLKFEDFLKKRDRDLKITDLGFADGQ
jgi:hypothetical protein